MYYGGDAIDLILIVIFCSQWYKDSRPKNSLFMPEREKSPAQVL